MIIPLLIIAIGVALILSSIWLGWKIYSSTKWRHAAGEIESADSFYAGSEIGRCSKVMYKYVVEEKEYFNSTIYVSASGRMMDFFLPIDTRYPKGSKVTVLYNPRKHKESALERGSWVTIISWLAMGVALVWVVLRRI